MTVVWALVAFVVGLVVGWLIASSSCRGRVADLESRIQNLKGSLAERDRTVGSLENRIRELEESASAVSQAEPAAVAVEEPEPVGPPDDLKRIEGIGPRISQLLQSEGIRTFQQLAEASVADLGEILSRANLRLADPATWPDQAGLAAAGEWRSLEIFQERLKGGRRV